jgi:hypothetical protein
MRGWGLGGVHYVVLCCVLRIVHRSARGGRKQQNKKPTSDVHLRQLAKKSTHVPSSFFFFFSAFLGVSRQGEFENTQGGGG